MRKNIKPQDRIGKRYNRLTTLAIVSEGLGRKFLFRCDCGRECVMLGSNVFHGLSTQCRQCGYESAAVAMTKPPLKCLDCGCELPYRNADRCKPCADKQKLDRPWRYPVSICTIARACGITKQAVSFGVAKRGWKAYTRFLVGKYGKPARDALKAA